MSQLLAGRKSENQYDHRNEDMKEDIVSNSNLYAQDDTEMEEDDEGQVTTAVVTE